MSDGDSAPRQTLRALRGCFKITINSILKGRRDHDLHHFDRPGCRGAGQIHYAGEGSGGIIVTILLGIGGSLVATYLGQFVGLYDEGESARFIGSTAGAILILWIYRVINKKKALSSGK